MCLFYISYIQIIPTLLNITIPIYPRYEKHTQRAKFDARGCCIYHPPVQLQERLMNNKWHVLHEHCPFCQSKHQTRREKEKKKNTNTTTGHAADDKGDDDDHNMNQRIQGEEEEGRDEKLQGENQNITKDKLVDNNNDASRRRRRGRSFSRPRALSKGRRGSTRSKSKTNNEFLIVTNYY